MFNLESIGKALLIGGGILAAVGIILFIASRLGLGRLPGDIIIERENLTIYFPLATMIIISIVVTILLNLLRR